MTQYDEGAGRILLGDNMGPAGGRVMLQPIRLQCVEVWTESTPSRVCIYSGQYV